jgi:CheY-like chemotaxis protein
MNLPTVLVVDDEPAICKAIARQLRGRFRIVSAGEAETALALLAQEAPVAVVADYYLPGRKGHELLREIRDRHPRVRRILLSGAPEVEIEALRAEGLADRYLAKPWSAQELIEFLESCCGRGSPFS